MNSTLTWVQVTPMRVQREFGIVRAALIAAQKLPAGSNYKQTVHISSSSLFLMFHTGTLLCYFFLISWISCAVFFVISFGVFRLWYSIFGPRSPRRFGGLSKLGVENFFFKITNLYVLFFSGTHRQSIAGHTAHTPSPWHSTFSPIFTGKLPWSQKDSHHPCRFGRLHPPLIVKWIFSYPNGVPCGQH